MNVYNPWTEEQQAEAKRMHDKGMSSREIGEKIGKTKSAVRRWFYYRRNQQTQRLRGLNLPYYARPVIPQEVLDDRDRRNAEAMTLNMLLLGDPVPSQSMLDFKRRIGT